MGFPGWPGPTVVFEALPVGFGPTGKPTTREPKRCAGHERRADGTSGNFGCTEGSFQQLAEASLKGGLRGGGETWKRKPERITCLFLARTSGPLCTWANLTS